MRRFVNVGRCRLNEVQIHQPVLVVVDPAHAGAHRFEVVLFVGLRGVLLKSNLRRFANVGVTDRNCRRGFRRTLR